MTDTQRIDELEKKLKLMIRLLDEARRRIGLSAILDDQLMAIDARAGTRAERH